MGKYIHRPAVSLVGLCVHTVNVSHGSAKHTAQERCLKTIE